MSQDKRREWWVLESSRVLHTNRYHVILDKEQVSEMHDWDANWFVKPKPQYVHVKEIAPNEVIVDRAVIEEARSRLMDFAVRTRGPAAADLGPLIEQLEAALNTNN